MSLQPHVRGLDQGLLKMNILTQRCVHANGTVLLQNVTRLQNEDDWVWTVNTTGVSAASNGSLLSPTATRWKSQMEQTLGPNVTCLAEVLPLPREMQFTQDTLVSVIAYTCMFVIALVGNLIVLVTLWGSRKYSRVNVCILHLCMADLFVAVIFLPLETTWHITVTWLAGDLACRIFMFLRAFGFYLSSFIIVVISLDRYFSIVHPLTFCDAHRRCKHMLGAAWVASVISSLPQSFIFHVERHPIFTWYKQCVTFNSFPSLAHELAYNLFNFVAVYVLPLIIITTCYLLIFQKVSRQRAKHQRVSRNCHTKVLFVKNFRRSGSGHSSLVQQGSNNTAFAEMRCSTSHNLSKARVRTLKMTLVIVSVFLFCWTPYFSILSFHWIAKEEAQKVDPKIQRCLFIFAVSNACFDPIIYGMFTSTFRRKAKAWKLRVLEKLSKLTATSVA